MMLAWSVNRSRIALHNRALGILAVHSENGKFVLTIAAARPARRCSCRLFSPYGRERDLVVLSDPPGRFRAAHLACPLL